MNENKELVLVTGGAGFIGSHTTTKLLEAGHRVVIIDNFHTGKWDNLLHIKDHPNLSVFQADLTCGLWPTLEKIRRQIGPIDRIVHFAAQISVTYSIEHPLEDTRINSLATLELIEYAHLHNVKRFLFSSSAAVYGDTDTIPTPEHATKEPLSPYAFNKLNSEFQLSTSHRLHGLSTVAFRFFNVYGPRQDPKSAYSGVISIFLDRAFNQQPLTLFGTGEQTRDFVYVEDIASLLTLACFSTQGAGQTFNVGTGTVNDIKTLAQTILSLSNSQSPLQYAPPRNGDILHSCADITQLNTTFGFSPSHDLAQGLSKTVDWFKTLHNKNSE